MLRRPRSRRALPILLLLSVACNRAENDLIGEWEFDAATYELIERYRSLDPEEQKHWVETARMNLAITKSTMRWEQELPGWGSREDSGSYRVLKSEGRRVDVAWAPGGKEETIVFTVEDDRLRFALRGRSIILKRVKPSGR